MNKQTSARDAKCQSRGWSDAMDSVSIAHRLAKLQELHDCWKFFQSGKKRLPEEHNESASLPESYRESSA